MRAMPTPARADGGLGPLGSSTQVDPAMSKSASSSAASPTSSVFRPNRRSASPAPTEPIHVRAICATPDADASGKDHAREARSKRCTSLKATSVLLLNPPNTTNRVPVHVKPMSYRLKGTSPLSAVNANHDPVAM
eukprot:657393-Rhodomonas_salina.4